MKKIVINLFGLFLCLSALTAQDYIPAGSVAIPSEYEVKNLTGVNSDQLDYSAVPFRNGIVFTSTRNRSTLFGCDSDFTNGHYSDLYFAKTDGEGNYSTPQLLEGDINGKYHDGTATFTSDQTNMYFSRNNRKGPNSFGTIDLKIYSSTISNNLWTDVNELPFNSDEYATCHPAVTPNGVWLYFASDRPGGYGGMDIYVVEKKRDGNWGTPVNLGSKINTTGNELFPFISPEGILYWSSNGFEGLGGLDVYSMPISNGEKAIRNHLTAPINSSGDDFGFTTNFEGTKGYLTSDRNGGKGKDDLYSWAFLGQKPKMANICVIDNDNGERIHDAFLELNPEPSKLGSASKGTIVKDGITYLEMTATQANGKEYLVLVPYDQSKDQAMKVKNLNGKSCDVKIPIIPGRMYEITVDKQGFQPLKTYVSANDILANDEYLVPIKKMPPIAMKGEVKDKISQEPIGFADVLVTNNCSGEEMKLAADRKGKFTFPLDCNCDYEITASKGNYQHDYELLYSYDMQCEEENTVVLLYLEKDMIPSKPAPKFKKGAVIRLDKLYYDYDKHFIRPDAALELDKVVTYMQEYPSLEIELGSHTDARGSDEYNRSLSQRRADAAVKYIISKGIASYRISAAGYGETKIVNRCGNGVDCSDYDHQLNRRTEIIVTNFEEENVRFEDK